MTIEVLCCLFEDLYSRPVAGQQLAALDWLYTGPCGGSSFGHVFSFSLLWCCRRQPVSGALAGGQLPG
jgi:hypothetical protein